MERERDNSFLKISILYIIAMFFILYSVLSWFTPLIHKDSEYLQGLQYPELITMSIAFGLIIPLTAFSIMHYNQKIKSYSFAASILIVAIFLISFFSFLLLNVLSDFFIVFFSKPRLVYTFQYVATGIVFVVSMWDGLNKFEIPFVEVITFGIIIILIIILLFMLFLDDGSILNKLSMSFTYLSLSAILLTKMKTYIKG